MRLKIITISIVVSLFTVVCGASARDVIKTIAKVNLSTCPKPEYPKPSLAANETGTVVVSLHVSKEGHVLETNFESSSGHQLLDTATLSAFSQCEFIPASANGAAVDSWIKMKYIWRIE
ncbi:energy transducer TonB [Collimonas sp.]|jgi:TonB family protein|uniref:energy transducer TonB n=1 Tax=Collimonas sp. TaxID=1963772 RepID=UPI002CE076CD|nr:energy transducer TonB [Collimonas sp.]HWX02235.1 energy transducer TonB [Collimonas sp.]